MIHIETNPSIQQKILPRLLNAAAVATLAQQSADIDADLTIVLTDDEQLRTLNREFLGQDRSTDVLSFPAQETDPETGAAYLGDILISLPRATEQAHLAGHTLEAELQLLVVHGVLHLLGHDHADVQEKASMWAAQTAVMNNIGLGSIRILE